MERGYNREDARLMAYRPGMVPAGRMRLDGATALRLAALEIDGRQS